jgi:hypothetical protein
MIPIALMISAMGFDRNLFVLSSEVMKPFDAHCICRIDTETLKTDVIWRGDLFFVWVQRAPKTGLVAFIGGRDPEPGVSFTEVLYITDENGRLLHEVKDVDTQFSWAPDGTRLAYACLNMQSRRPNGEMWILDIASGQKEKIPNVGFELYWSRRTGSILFWGSEEGDAEAKLRRWDPATKKTTETRLPSLDLSPTEEFSFVHRQAFSEVYQICGYETTPSKIASINDPQTEIRSWLSGRLLRARKFHRDNVFDPFWYVFDCEKRLLYESKDNPIAADEENSLLVVRDGKIAQKKLEELTPVPLDRLKIVVSPQDQPVPKQPGPAKPEPQPEPPKRP